MRTTARLTLAGLASAVLFLSACGNDRTSTVKDTVPGSVDTTVATSDSTVTTDSVADTVAVTDTSVVDTTAGTPTTAGSVSVTIDPALEKAISDVDTLLGSNATDLDQAAQDAANGG